MIQTYEDVTRPAIVRQLLRPTVFFLFVFFFCCPLAPESQAAVFGTTVASRLFSSSCHFLSMACRLRLVRIVVISLLVEGIDLLKGLHLLAHPGWYSVSGL